MNTDLIQKVVTLAGGQTALASFCATETGKPVKQSHVWNWLNRDLCIPPEFILSSCKAIEWVITPHELNPRIYPNESDGLPLGEKHVA